MRRTETGEEKSNTAGRNDNQRHTGNGEQEKTYMDIGGRETPDMGTQV